MTSEEKSSLPSENQQHTEEKAFILMIIYTQREYWKIHIKSYYSHHVVGCIDYKAGVHFPVREFLEGFHS